MASKYQISILDDKQIHQGDIFKSLSYYDKYLEKEGRFELSVLKFPYSIILTQECDLNNNKNERESIVDLENNSSIEGSTLIKHDKYLVSLLCAPLYNAEHLFLGNHLERLNIKSDPKNSNQKNYIKSNRDPRYHYLEFEDSISLVPMVIDFKHYYTISIDVLENNLPNRVCSLQPIFRELVTQRFSNFLSRIGLPNPN